MSEGRGGKVWALALGVDDSEATIDSGPEFGEGRPEVRAFGVTVVDVSNSSSVDGRRGSDFENGSGRPRVKFTS